MPEFQPDLKAELTNMYEPRCHDCQEIEVAVNAAAIFVEMGRMSVEQAADNTRHNAELRRRSCMLGCTATGACRSGIVKLQLPDAA